MNMSPATLLTFLTMLLLILEASAKPVKITIIDQTPGPLYLHCYDNNKHDTGLYTLAPNHGYVINFNQNLMNSIKWHCDFRTETGFGNYGVFTRRLWHKYCGRDCQWFVKPEGPCVNIIDSPGKFYCQGWTNELSSDMILSPH